MHMHTFLSLDKKTPDFLPLCVLLFKLLNNASDISKHCSAFLIRSSSLIGFSNSWRWRHCGLSEHQQPVTHWQANITVLGCHGKLRF